MTKEQQDLCRQLIMNYDGTVGISDVEFLRRFPSALEHGKLSLSLLEDAFRMQNGEDLDCTLIIGFNFGFGSEHMDILCKVVDADWHMRQEDVVSALVDFKSVKAVEPFFRATQWVPKKEDLYFHEVRTLAVKAIWGLGAIPGGESETKLQILAGSDHPILRKSALEQLARRHKRA